MSPHLCDDYFNFVIFCIFSNFETSFRPVSAYALFFRDTQAAIKGQNPNASFGEVSKIVASMWDALDSEHKNVSSACNRQFKNMAVYFSEKF